MKPASRPSPLALSTPARVIDAGPVNDSLANLGGNFGALGFAIVGVFLVSWAGSTLIYKMRRYDEMDVAIAASIGRKV